MQLTEFHIRNSVKYKKNECRKKIAKTGFPTQGT